MDSGFHRFGATDRQSCMGTARGPVSGMFRAVVPAGGPGGICRCYAITAGLHGADSYEPAAYAAADRPMRG